MLLEVSSISKKYRSFDSEAVVLSNVDIAVDEQEVVGLVSESGGGKSTLANIIAGLEEADCGSVVFDGVDLEVEKSLKRRSVDSRRSRLGIQMVFQNPIASFSERMKIGQGIMEGLAYRDGFEKKAARSKVHEALDMVSLPRTYVDKHAWELSGGECQRAAIARAIISNPRLLICDEPTSALDVTVQAHIVDLLANLCSGLSMSCLFISHDLALVRGLCDRMYVLDGGTIVEQGNTEDLFSRPRSSAFTRLLSALPTL